MSKAISSVGKGDFGVLARNTSNISKSIRNDFRRVMDDDFCKRAYQHKQVAMSSLTGVYHSKESMQQGGLSNRTYVKLRGSRDGFKQSFVTDLWVSGHAGSSELPKERHVHSVKGAFKGGTRKAQAGKTLYRVNLGYLLDMGAKPHRIIGLYTPRQVLNFYWYKRHKQIWGLHGVEHPGFTINIFGSYGKGIFIPFLRKLKVAYRGNRLQEKQLMKILNKYL